MFNPYVKRRFETWRPFSQQLRNLLPDQSPSIVLCLGQSEGYLTMSSSLQGIMCCALKNDSVCTSLLMTRRSDSVKLSNFCYCSLRLVTTDIRFSSNVRHPSGKLPVLRYIVYIIL